MSAAAASGGGPGPILRALYRLPLVLERAGIGGFDRLARHVVGVDWIVLETVGRRTGRPHVVVLDVVGRDAPGDAYYVQPAYGRGADWVRNVLREPRVTARVGERRFRARVRDATGAEGAEVVLRFLRTHRWYGRLVVWFVGYVDRLDRADAELRPELERTLVLAIEAER